MTSVPKTATGPAAALDPAIAPRGARGAALIRDVILGGQDGLVNVLGLVLGMAVATGSSRVVVTAGLAALLAESIAMAGVAFTATGAERQLGVTVRSAFDERREALAAAHAEARRTRLVASGIPDEVITLVEVEAAAEDAVWLSHAAVMRTALAPVRETRPVRAAAVVGLSTAAGSCVPLLPFVLLPISIAPAVALAAAGLVLAFAGMERAHATGGRATRAAAEMVVIGLVSAFAGYLIGQVLRSPIG